MAVPFGVGSLVGFAWRSKRIMSSAIRRGAPGAMPVGHLEGISNYCRTNVPLGIGEAINGNIKSTTPPRTQLSKSPLFPLKVQRRAALKTEFVVRVGDSGFQIRVSVASNRFFSMLSDSKFLPNSRILALRRVEQTDFNWTMVADGPDVAVHPDAAEFQGLATAVTCAYRTDLIED